MERRRTIVACELGVANAIRRALIRDIPNLAPEKCTIRVNTSCLSDEFVAQRIGLISFVSEHKSPQAVLRVCGRNASSGDFQGAATPLYANVLVAPLREAQEIDLTVHFAEATGARHARYARTVAVGMRSLDEDTHEISFEDILDDHVACWRLAVDSLIARLGKVRELAVQAAMA